MKEIPSRNSLHFTSKYTREVLSSYRQKGDTYADKVVEELQRLKGLVNIHDLLGVVIQRAENEEDKINGPFSSFLNEVERVPEWVDMAKVQRGQRVQAVYSTIMYFSLFAGSLVGGSMFKSAAMVTAMAGNLADRPAQRTQETALIIANLIFPNALEKGGRAREALIRVRLLHAGLRHWLVVSGRYKRKDEIAINQQDLAITLALFGYLNIRSLSLMGVDLTDEEIDDYLHMWRYSGFLLGIEESLLPLNYKDQEDFFLASCIDEAKPEWIPREVKNVLDAQAQQVNKDTFGIVPFEIAQTLFHQITRYLCGNEYCSGMELEDRGNDCWPVLMMKGMGKSIDFIAHNVPFGKTGLASFNTFQVNRLIEAQKRKTHGEILGGKINVASNALEKVKLKAKL